MVILYKKYYRFSNFFLKEGTVIEIIYNDNRVRKLCTDFVKAKKDLPIDVAGKLHALINFIISSENLYDIAKVHRYHFHSLQGKRAGQYAIDISGRKSGYRLIIIPYNPEIDLSSEKNINIIYRTTEVIVVLEVSNHYE